MIREYRKTNQTGAWDYGEVESYLKGKGYLFGGGGVSAGLDENDPTTVVVRADIDPNVPQATLDADLDAFVPTPDPVAEAQIALRRALAFTANPPAGATVEDRLARVETEALSYARILGVI